jgi:hypothetical protein
MTVLKLVQEQMVAELEFGVVRGPITIGYRAGQRGGLIGGGWR